MLSFSNTEISKKFGTLKVGSLAGREARSGAGITIYDQGKNNVLSALAQALSSSQFASTYGGQVRDIKMQIWGKCIHMPHRVSVACRATPCKAAGRQSHLWLRAPTLLCQVGTL